MSATFNFSRISLCVLALILTSSLSVSTAFGAAATTSTTLAITDAGVGTSAVSSGTVVTLTATVKAGSTAIASGFVNFCVAGEAACTDIHLIGTAQLVSGGKATVKFVPPPGSHSYKAVFTGTVSDTLSTSTAEPLTVYGATKTTIAQSGSAGNYTLKATVIGTGEEVAPAGDVSFRDTSKSNEVLANAVLGKGTGAITWSNPQNPATEPEPISIAVSDFNGDGIPDIVIGTTGAKGYLSILLGNGNGTFQAAKTFAALPNNQALAVGQFLNGGPEDILTVSSNASGTNNIAMFKGNGAGSGTLGTPFNLGGIANVTGLAVGDFNRDGNEDFVVTGVIYGVYCFAPVLGTGKGTFGGTTLNSVGSDPLLVAVGAFGKSDYPDIVVTDTGLDQVTIFQNNGQGYFFPDGQANSGSKPTAMVTGDFNGDGYTDVAVANSGSNTVTILLGKGNYTLTPASASPAVGHDPVGLAVGDFNGDGIADLAVLNKTDKTVTILLGKGDGTFTNAGTHGTGLEPASLVSGNFSGLGDSDFVVTNQNPAATTGSTLTVEAETTTQTATATANGISPSGTGAHLMDAEYQGDSLFDTSVSSTTSLNGLVAAATPTFSPAAGTYASTQTVKIGDTTSGATTYYTTDGTQPTTGSTKYTVAITVSASETIKAIAVASGHGESAVGSAAYVIKKADTPTFSPAGGTYSSTQSVKLSDGTTGATIYYTTSGGTPTTGSTKYTGAISVSSSKTIKAIAVASGYEESAVGSATYTIK